jgi:Na+/H+ antiporter NhaD/arsenite permease-like protein
VLVGTGLLLASGQIQFEQLKDLIDLDTLVLLFSMMVLNVNLRLAGFFNAAGNSILRWTRSPRIFLGLEILVIGVLSALFLNDTICLMMTPLMIEITSTLKRNPIPYLIALATASNIGSTATVTGNPQNMIIGVASGISYTQFSAALIPPAFLGLGVIWLVLILFYPSEFKKESFEIVSPAPANISPAMLRKNMVVVAGMLAAFLAGVPVALAALLAACVLLITRRTQPQTVFAELDWSLLVFFAGMFVVSGALEVNGINHQLFSLLNISSQTNALNLSIVTAILSNLVSNVPAVLLLKPVIGQLANPEAGWLTLAAASTLAGNLTLLGSVANLIVAESAGRWRIELGFVEYTRAGILITVLSLSIGIIYISLFIWL